MRIKYIILKIQRYFSIIIYSVLCFLGLCIISMKKTDKNKLIYNFIIYSCKYQRKLISSEHKMLDSSTVKEIPSCDVSN